MLHVNLLSGRLYAHGFMSLYLVSLSIILEFAVIKQLCHLPSMGLSFLICKVSQLARSAESCVSDCSEQNNLKGKKKWRLTVTG